MAAVVAVLCAVPVVVGQWPVRAADVDVTRLRDRMAASVQQPFQGFAQSVGTLGLPALPGLEQVTALVSGTTHLRTWYAARDRWRVDVIGPGTEEDLYQTPDAQYVWDYGRNQLSRIDGRPPVRLPRAADLTPPDLVRRLLSVAAGDRAEPLPDRRVAGIAAAGLRLVPVAEGTTVAHVDIWADPRTGLPLQAEITARGGRRPVFTTRFLEVQLTAPAADVLTPPAGGPDSGFTVTRTPDIVSALDRWVSGHLPDELAARPRRAAVQGVSSVGVYGTGMAQFVVLDVPGRIGWRAYENAAKWGKRLSFPDGEAALITTGLLSVLIVRGQQTYLVAGFVDATLLQQVAADLVRIPA